MTGFKTDALGICFFVHKIGWLEGLYWFADCV